MRKLWTMLLRVVYAPSFTIQNDEMRRRVQMIISLAGSHLVVTFFSAVGLLIVGDLRVPVVVHFLLNGIILALIYARLFKWSIWFFLSTYVLTNFVTLLFAGLSNILYGVTAFVAVSMVLNRRFRLPYAVSMIVIAVVLAAVIADEPGYASLTHSDAVAFVVFGIIAVFIATSVVEGDLTQIQTQLHRLKESEARYLLLAENVSDMITLHTRDGHCVYASPSYIQATGYGSEELLCMSPEDVRSLVHPDDLRNSVEEKRRLVLQGEAISQYEYRHRRKDGRYFWVEAHAKPIFDSVGQVSQVIVSTRDIHERKQVEEALRQSEAQLAEAQHITHLGSWEWSLSTNQISWSDELFAIFGIAREDFRGTYDEYISLIHPDDRAAVISTTQEAVNNRQPYAMYHRVIHPQKGERIIHGQGRSVFDSHGNLLSLIGTGQDVTDIKRAEDALRIRNSYLTTLHAITLDLLNRDAMDDLLQTIVDKAAAILEAPYVEMALRDGNEMVAAAVTTQLSSIKGERATRDQSPITWHVYEILQPLIVEDYRELAGKGEVYEELNFRSVAVFPVLIGKTCIGVLGLARSQENYPFTAEQIEIGTMFSQLTALVVDNANHYRSARQEIVERTQAEIALRQSEQRAQALLNAIPDLVFRLNTEGVFLDFKGDEANLFTPKEAIIGRSISAIGMPETLAQTTIALIHKALNEHSIQSFDYQLDAQDFEARLVVSGEAEVIAIVRNITERKKLELALREKHDELERFFTSALDLLCIANTDGFFLKLNREWESVLGYALSELEGKHSIDFIHPEDILTTTDALTTLSHETPLMNFTNRYRHKDGSYRLIEWRSFPHQGKIYATARDITIRRQMEEALRQSERRAQALLNAIPDQVYRIACDGTILDAAGNLTDMFFTREEVLGQNIRSVTSFWDIPAGIIDSAFATIEATSRTHQTQVFEFQTNLPLVGLHEFEARVVSSGANEITTIVRDVTERKRAENRQAQLTAQLKAANAELESFAYIVSHDLKSPLRGVNAIASWLQTDYYALFDSNGLEMLDLLKGRVRRMDAMINALLEFSRLGRVQGSKTPVDLNALVRDVIVDIAPAEHCTITIDTPLPTIDAELVRIRQVFQNLLDNAVKYIDKPRGEIRITCEQQGDLWLFRVCDNGPGIEARHFEKIFQIFQTLHPRDQIEGTGIGLTIVKRIVELQGGKIWVESTVGQGTTFVFTMPIEARA